MAVDLAEAKFLFGTEHEMAARVIIPGMPGFQVPGYRKVSQILGCGLPDGVQSLDLFERRWLSNGGLLYIDHEHIEAATPEVEDTRDLVEYELSNEQIARHLLDEAKEQGFISDATLDATVADKEGNSWGYHINLLLERKYLDLGRSEAEIKSDPIMQQFALFLATWGIIAGNGGIVRDFEDGKLKFYVMTKSSTLLQTYHEMTTEMYKPLVNLRNEPLAGPEYTRMHIISGDYNTSPWSKRMAAGMCALTLKALCLGLRLDEDFPIQPDTLHRMAKTVAKDPTCKEPLTLDDGRTTTAVDIQYAFLNMAKKLKTHCDLNEDMEWVLGEWERALGCLKNGPTGLEDSASWPLKYRHLSEIAMGSPDGWADEKLHMWEFGYHHITPDPKATLTKLRKHPKAWGKYMPSAEAIQRAMREPPETRAKLRGAFVVAHVGKGTQDVSVRWDSVAVIHDELNRTTYELMDPYAATNPELEAYLATLR